MINDIEVQKFKRFKDQIKIEDLSNVNYLIGKNNSGKSSFLQAVLLSTLYRNTDGSNFINFSFPERFAGLKEYFSDEDLSDPIKIVISDKNNKEIITKSQWINESVRKEKTGEGKIPRTLYIPCNVQISMGNDKFALKDINNEIDSLGILPVDKINSWIYHQEHEITGSTREKKGSEKFIIFEKIIEKEFDLKILLPEPDTQCRFCLKYLENRKERNLHLLGSGAQNVVYFIGAIVYLSDYDLILIDEPELHLHPAIQKRLGNIFRKLSKQFDIQFIIATQSPFIISNLTKEDSVYILKKKGKKIINKESNFINTAVAIELGGEPSDVGAPENFILLEEASMEVLLREANDRFFKKNIQFISCSGINRTIDEAEVIKNIVDYNLLLKCTPIYLSKYFIITDKLTRKIKTDDRIARIQEKLKSRFVEMDFRALEDVYSEECLKNFITKHQKQFTRNKIGSSKKRIKDWMEESKNSKERGKKKRILAKFIAADMTERDFKKTFSKLLKIFK